MFCVTVVGCAFVNTTNIAHCLFTIKIHLWHIPCIFEVEKCILLSRTQPLSHMFVEQCVELIDWLIAVWNVTARMVKWLMNDLAPTICVLKWSMLNSAGVECEAEMIWCNVSKHDKKDTQMFEHKTHWQNRTIFVLNSIWISNQPVLVILFLEPQITHIVSIAWAPLLSLPSGFWHLPCFNLLIFNTTHHITSCVDLSHQATISRFMW